MIKITKFTMSPSDADTITEHDCQAVAEAVVLFDQQADNIIARCETDAEYLGMLFGVRRANDPIAAAAMESAAPGAVVEIKVWKFKSQLPDGPGWRVVYGREMAQLQKPAATEAPSPAEAPPETAH
ncbi:MAG: hypothetical protein ACYDEA_01145 [Candidatus Dormibacteria bacterium]